MLGTAIGNARQWSRRHRRLVIFVALTLVAAVIVLVHGQLYRTFFFDDSFISLRYSDRLRSGLGLTWTDGERVEGYSNLLWVVLIAGLGVFGGDLVTIARILGVTSTAIAASALGLAQRNGATGWSPAITALVGLLLCGPVAAWAMGGLEVSLLIGLLALATLLLSNQIHDGGPWTFRAGLGPGIAAGLMAWTRPDGAGFGVALALGVVLAAGFRAIRSALCLAGGSVLAFGLQMGFRRLYYDAWLPNTSTKLATSWSRVEEGWKYLTDWNYPRGLLLIGLLAVVLSMFDRRMRQQLLLLLPSLAFWCAYVVAVGGDFMPQRRHLVPAIWVVTAFAAAAVHVLTRWWGSWVGWLVVGALGVDLYHTQTTGSAVKDANNSDWYWAAQPIAQVFQRSFSHADPLLAVDAAGALPYFWKGRSLDMLGLNDRHIAESGAKGGALAHNLGDGKYVLSRKPDLVVFHLPWGQPRPQWRSGREMVRQPEWSKYSPVFYVANMPVRHGVVWVRADGPLGPQQQGDVIRIPAYLFASSPEAPLDGRNEKLSVVMGPGTAAQLSLKVPKGRWHLELDVDQMLLRSPAEWLEVKPGLTVEGGSRKVNLVLKARRTLLLTGARLVKTADTTRPVTQENP